MVSSIFDGVLVVASGCAMYVITPSAPYAFTAAAVACVHGLAGLLKRYKGYDEDDEDKEGWDYATGVLMELLPLPLYNIELYMRSQNSTHLALGHAAFAIPLLLDFVAHQFDEDRDAENTSKLQELTVMGNVVSMVFYGLNEDKYGPLLMAFVAFCCRYVPYVMAHYFEGTGHHTIVVFDSLLCAAACLVFGEAKA